MNRNLGAVAVTETWLNADIDSTLATPPGFQCSRTDRACKSSKRVGVTVIVISQRWCSSPAIFPGLLKQDFVRLSRSIKLISNVCGLSFSYLIFLFAILAIDGNNTSKREKIRCRLRVAVFNNGIIWGESIQEAVGIFMCVSWNGTITFF